MVESSASVARPVVVYDGDCAFCTRSIRRVQRIDWLRRFDHRPFGASDGDREPGIRVALPNGTTRVGIDAVRSILVRTPLGVLPGLMLFVPGIHWLAARGYGWVARNRHRFA